MKGILFVFVLFTSISSFANISFSPSYVNFGDVSIDRSFGLSRTINLYNHTNEAMNVNVTDNCFGEIRVRSSCYYLSAYGTCMINVNFQPKKTGTFFCSIRASGERGSYSSADLRGRGVESTDLEVNEPFIVE